MFRLETEHPVALDSPDHIEPRGARFDNSISLWFNAELIKMVGYKPKVLDFGCAGGGMVRTLLNDGCTAVGLEGCDWNLKHQKHEWPHIPEYLFTCDLRYPFLLHLGNRQPYKFDVVTMWEFIEHIPMDRIDTVLENAKKHMKPAGYIIGSTNDLSVVYNGIEHHLTLQPMSWWYAKFSEHGFCSLPEREAYFDKHNAWVRKSKSAFVVQLEK